jgi:hypothetical protein
MELIVNDRFSRVLMSGGSFGLGRQDMPLPQRRFSRLHQVDDAKPTGLGVG